MRILLVQPYQKRTTGFQQFGRVEPLGLEMIAGALRERHEVGILDLRIASDSLSATLAEFNPELVGISSSFTPDIYQTFRIAEAVKGANPRTFVVVGGHHPSLHPLDFHRPTIDAIVMGEGEITIQELADGLEAGGDPAEVAGLMLNRLEGQQATGPRHLVSDLDSLPYPRRALTRTRGLPYTMPVVGPVAMVETTRGCPYQCNFCSVWRFYKGRVRFKSPQRVVEELEQVEEPSVSFSDDNFLAGIPRAEEIARLVEERRIRKKFFIQARSDAIARHPELIARWAKLGLISVFIGFEKPDQKGLEWINKHNSVENNERALEILRSHGIEPITTFIVNPGYDRGDFQTLRAYVRRLKLGNPAFPILTPLPGTPLFDEMKGVFTTHNYELWDLAHLVIPSRLPVEEFCKEEASLWRTAYPRWKMMLGKAYLAWQQLSGREDAPELQAALSEVLRLQDPHYFIRE